MNDIASLTISEMGHRFRNRSLSPRDVIASLQDRIAKLDPIYNVFLQIDLETALKQARHAEHQFAHGHVIGSMHGIPYVTKDNIDVAGVPTTCHSKVTAGHVAETDAFVIQKLRAAGAILIGKVALHEFARGGAMTGLPWPPARNPWDPSRHPGGSSSGSGAAVAAKMVPAAIGTDTGGSVRHPATACGVVGLKPTYGAISRRGVMPLAFSLDTVGPLTRNVEDNAILFESLMGYDAYDPTSATSTCLSCVSDLRRGIRDMRIGLIEHFYREDMEADADYCAAIDVAVEVFKSLGAHVTRARLSPLSAWTACGNTILDAESFTIHEKWLKERPQDYSRNSRSKILVGGFIPASKYLQAQKMLTVLRTEFETTMQKFDVVITMSSMEPPCDLDNEAEVARSYGRHARMPFNVTGSPAISIPIGFGTQDLPIGLQIAGKPFDEPTVYRAAWAYCNATSWTALSLPEPPAKAPSKAANLD